MASIIYIFTPRAHARARGYVIGRGVYYIYIVIYCYISAKLFFYLSKDSLSEVYFNTDRLLIEFNGLWYSLAARQVFVAIANPDSLSLGKGSTTPETQTLHRPHPYTIADAVPEHAYSTTALVGLQLLGPLVTVTAGQAGG